MSWKRLARLFGVHCAVITIAVLALGSECKLPGAKSEGMKVTKIRDLEVILVRTKKGSGLELDEFSKVRLIGFGAPPTGDRETRIELGKTLHKMLVDKNVKLDYETPGQPSLSVSNELLAYVYLDDMLVNAELLRLGLGRFSGEWGGKRYQDQLKQAEAEAKEAGRGMWSRISETGGDANSDTGDYDYDYDYDY